MVMLILAVDKISLLLRPNLIIQSIKDVFKPYLICWLCLLVVIAFLYAVVVVSAPLIEQKESSGLNLIAYIFLLDVDLFPKLYSISPYELPRCVQKHSCILLALFRSYFPYLLY